MSRWGVVLLVLSLGASASCTRIVAQVPRVRSGSIVRVQAHRVLPGRVQGRVVDVTRDSLLLMPEAGSPVTIGGAPDPDKNWTCARGNVEAYP